MKKLKKCFDKFIWVITGVKSDSLGYRLISFVGLLIRLIILPFFVTLAYKAAITKGFVVNDFPVWLVEIIARGLVILSGFFLSTRLINKMAYVTVGNFYERGKKPEIGSFFYNLFYILYQLMPIFLFGPFGWWGYGVTIGLYITVCIAGYFVGEPAPEGLREIPAYKNKGTYPKNWIIRTVLFCIITVLVFVGAFLFQWFIY